jgi:glutathione synthase/RimK-type ligase-like ATP-grasp enzyme
MKCLILLSQHSPSGEKFVQKLSSYNTDNHYQAKKYDELAVLIKNNQVKIFSISDDQDVLDFDLVFLRGTVHAPLRHAITDYLNFHGKIAVNSESLTYQRMTKLEQNVHLALNQLPVPDSLYLANLANVRMALEAISGFSFPLVAKSINGRNGNDNEIVKSVEEIQQLPFNDLILQPFIPNDFDYRVITAGEKVLLAYKRIRGVGEENYKNNISRGGRREMIELDHQLAEMAVKAANVSGREFSGLDILVDKDTGKSVILEVNYNFGTPDFDDSAIEQKFYHQIDDYFSSLLL